MKHLIHAIDSRASVVDWRTIPDRSFRAAVYCRYSTDMQSEKSCDDQERDGFELAKRHSLVVTHVEHDAAMRAGAWGGRDGYQRLLAAAERGEFGILIVENINRFSRESLKGFAAAEILTRHGVKLMDRSGLIDPEKPEGRMRLFLGLESAEGETVAKRDQVRRGHKGKALAKFSTGGRPPFGICRDPLWSATENDPDGRPKRIGVHWAPDPETRDLLLRIFELCDQGVPGRRIGKLPEIAGPMLRDRKDTKRRVRPYVSEATIHALLRNEIYIGRRVWGKLGRTGAKDDRTGKKRNVPQPNEQQVEVESFCDAIVPMDLWERVQKRLDDNAQAVEKRGIANPGRGYLLSGLIKCAHCGFAFVLNSGGKNRPAYYCGTRKQHGKDACPNKCSVFQEPLEATVKHTIEKLVKDPQALAAMVAEHNRKINAANTSQLTTVKSLEDARKKLIDERDNLVKGIRAGKAIDILVQELERTETELAELDGKVAEAMDRVQPLLMVRTVRDVQGGDAPLFTGISAEDNALVRTFVDEITVYKSGHVLLLFQETSPLENIHSVQAAMRLPVPKVAPSESLTIARAKELNMRTAFSDHLQTARKKRELQVAIPDPLQFLDNAGDPTGNRTRD